MHFSSPFTVFLIYHKHFCDEANEEFATIDGALYEKGATGATDYEVLVVWPYNKIVIIGEGKTILTAEDTEFVKSHIGSKFHIADTVTEIGDAAFWNHTGLYAIVIPEGVTTIGVNAFNNCRALTDLVIPDSVSSIGAGAFQNCVSLTSITIPEKVTVLEKNTFYNCAGMEELVLSDNLTSIGEGAFWNCTSLKTVHFPDGMTSIGYNAFDGCKNLEKVVIPRSVNSMGSYVFRNCTELCSAGPVGGEYNIEFGWDEQIPANAFYGCTSLTEITVPDGVKSIGTYAFYNCGNLSKITIPGSVTSIGTAAFTQCRMLVTAGPAGGDYNIEFGWTDSIPSSAFSNCNTLTDAVIPEGITALGQYAFYYCENLSHINLPKSVKEIGNYCFSNCANLCTIGPAGDGYHIEIGEMEEIPERAFSDYKFITEVHFPDSVKKIGEYAFYNCDGLTSITIPEGVTFIGEDAFGYCERVKELRFLAVEMEDLGYCNDVFHQIGAHTAGVSVFIGAKVTRIPANLMNPHESGSKIINLVFEENSSCTTIGSKAFLSCDFLDIVYIPASVTTIQTDAFAECGDLMIAVKGREAPSKPTSNWTDGVVLENVKSWGGEVGGFSYFITNDDTAIISSYTGDDTNVQIPEKIDSMPVSAIASHLFMNREDIRSISLPDCVTEIGGYAFYGCSGLEEINLPESVSSIGRYAFYGCSGLTDIHIPDSVTEIGMYAFYSCTGLSDLVMPSDLANIGAYAFYGCSGLKTLALPPALESIGESAFEKCTSAEYLTIPESVVHIGRFAFDDCTSLCEIHYNASVLSDRDAYNHIFGNAGRNGEGAKVIIGANVTRIPEYLFCPYAGDNTPNIVSLEFESGSICQSIGQYAFNGCKYLKTIEIPENVTSIGEYAFYNCTAVEKLYFNATAMDRMIARYCYFGYLGTSGDGVEIIVGKNVTKIPAGFMERYTADQYQINISSVVFEEGSVCQTIGNSAFQYCASLREIVLPESLIDIEASAFDGCSNLESVVIPKTMLRIEDLSFYCCGSLQVVRIDSPVIAEMITTSSCGGLCQYAKTVIVSAQITDLNSSIPANFTYTEELIIDDEAYISYSNHPHEWEHQKSVEYIECVQDGVDTYCCSNCGMIKRDVVHAHDYQEHIVKEADCLNDGVAHKVCSRCEHTVAYIIRASGKHVYDDWYTIEEETDYSEGLSRRDCQNCTHYETGAFTTVDSGICGPCTEWVLKGNGQLWIYGTGETFSWTIHSNAPWSSYRNDVTSVYIEDDVTKVGSWAFYKFKKLSDVRFGDRITVISGGMFSGCSSLAEITIPEQVTVIDAQSFENCTALTSITIPQNVTYLGEHAFYSCTALETIRLNAIAMDDIGKVDNRIFYNAGANSGGVILIVDADVTRIPSNLFTPTHAGTSSANLIRVVFEEGSVCESIGSRAFYSCTALTDFVIPESVTTIGGNAFYGCTSLEGIVIPQNVFSIGGSAFNGCTSLASAVFLGDAPSIGSNVFSKVTATAYYPENNETWQAELLQNYGGTIEWIPVCKDHCYESVVVPQTCTAWGSTTLTCTVCGISFVDRYLEPTGHSYESEVIAPTNETWGYTSHICTICGDSYTDNFCVIGKAVEKGSCGSDLSWILDGSGTLWIGGKGGMDSWSSSSYVPWYSFRSSVTSVKIHNGVSSIGDYAFYQCENLTSVTISDSVTDIGSYAFSGCKKLTAVMIPDGVTDIGGSAFYNCSSLTSIRIPDGVTSIENSVFSGCSKLTEITIPDRVTSIGNGAFSGCSSLTGISIPDSVTSIGDSAFSSCGKLTDITIPDGVTSIGNNTFRYCSCLASITIPDTVTSIGEYAFQNCSSLTSIEIPDSMTSIGEYAFQQCSKLTSITIPDGVTSIGKSAFYGCTSLNRITIPGSVTNIGANPFGECTSLAEIRVADNNTYYSNDENGVLFNKEHTALVQVPGGWEGDYAVPTGVTTICDYAFYQCTKITGIELPETVTSIGDYVFLCCRELASITIPDGVTAIGTSAFYGCGKLTSVTIPNSVTSIGNSAFYSCSILTSLEIPDSVTSIGNFAFGYCNSLTDVALPENITSIGSNLFYYCSSLNSATIPAGVTSIGNSAFYNCTNLKRIVFNATAVNDLASSNNVFYKAGTSDSGIIVEIGANVTRIPAHLFNPNNSSSYAPKITSVVFEKDSVCESIGASAFRYCTYLNEVRFTGNVPAFGDSNVFGSVTATAYFPTNNDTWTTDVMQNYGGALTWKPMCTEHEWGDWSVVTKATCEQEGEKYRDCAVCDQCETEPIPATGHSYESVITEPSCTEQGYTTYTCTACGDSYMDSYVDALGHTAGDAVAENNVEATCEIDGSYDNVVYCAVCETELNRETVTIPATGHSYGEWETTREPTCTETGEKRRDCVVCDHFETESLAVISHSHEAVVTDPTCTEEGFTVYTCSVCGNSYVSDYVSPYGHSYESSVTDSTCTAQGYTNHTCKVCGDTYQDSYVEAQGHTMGDWYPVVDATCVEDGKERRDCMFCDYFESQTIPATDHTWDDGVVTVEATEVSEGEMRYTCISCGETRTEVIPMLEHVHSYESVVTEPSCTEDGFTTYTCRCGNSYTDEFIGALGHDMSAWSVVVDATCTENGEEHRTCSRCDYAENQIIPAIGHSHESVVKDPTCSAQGYTIHICNNCGDSYADSYTDALGHSFTHYISNGNATCIEDGTMTAVCDRCDATNTVTEAGSATGHFYESVVTEPSCTEQGYTTYTCTACGDSYVDNYTDAAGHDYQSVVMQDPSCTENGERSFTCTACGDSYTAVIPATGHSYDRGFCNNCGEADPDYEAVELASGWSGDTTWVLMSNGVLTFSGEGMMRNYTYKSEMPWYAYVDQITRVVIEDGITRIGDYAFYGMNIESIQIPESVTVIGVYAFKNCTELDNVILPASLTKLGESAFYGCTSLKEIYIPDGLYTIWSYTFKGCTVLESVRLPKSLIKIDQGAFENCTSLDYIFMPTNVEIIGNWSFKGCSGLKEADMQWVDATEIREGAFKNCASLTKIILPDGIQVLGDSCFYGIGAISFTVPETVTSIEAWCFARAYSLREISFEGNAPVIGEGAFNKIALKAYYSADNATWTSDVMQNYGGKINWIALPD